MIVVNESALVFCSTGQTCTYQFAAAQIDAYYPKFTTSPYTQPYYYLTASFFPYDFGGYEYMVGVWFSYDDNCKFGFLLA